MKINIEKNVGRYQALKSNQGSEINFRAHNHAGFILKSRALAYCEQIYHISISNELKCMVTNLKQT
jgi:hypothetical protein